MSDLTFQDVLNILRLIDSGPFSDVQIEYEGTRLKVTRQTGNAPVGAETRMQTVHAGARSTPPAKMPAAPARGTSPEIDQKKAMVADSPARQSPVAFANGIEVKPPMAGTYYASPSPNAAPFVEVDRAVRKGDQLGVVEVMKLFTAVLSPCDGIVRAILVGNEEFVHSDQPLMIIEAAQ